MGNVNTGDITQQNTTNIETQIVIQGNTLQTNRLHPQYHKVFKSLIENRLTLFGGRDTALAQIAKFINKLTGGYLVITAPAGFGKTSLMAKLVSEASETFADHFFAPYENPNSVTEEGFLRNVIEQMAHWHGYTDTLPEKLPDLDALYHRLLGEPLEHTHVLVIDGLDEVTNWEIARYLRRRLPDNLHIIVTVRDVGQDLTLDYDFPKDQTEYLPLEGLTRNDVADVLRKAGKGATVFADNPTLLKEVMRISAYQEEPSLGADPFYVRLLAEDAADGRLTPANIASQPKGLNKYLSAWWREIEESEENNEPLEDLFGTLTVALGAISRADLETINSSLVSKKKKNFFHKILDQVRRWIVGNEVKGYALVHPRLRDYICTEIYTDELLEGYREKLLTFCASWQEHRSLYALRYYAEHLRDAKRWDELYELARNKAFADAQRQQLPDEPELPLKNIRIALQTAAERDDAGAIAEFLLAHARQLLLQESPLEVLRSGNLKRALAVADMCESERSVLWYLLLAWELKDKHKQKEAHEVLIQLLQKQLPCFSIHFAQGEWAFYLLTQICQVNEDTFSTLYQCILPSNELYEFCIKLLDEGYLDIALKIVEQINWSTKSIISLNSTLEFQNKIENKDSLNANYWYKVKSLTAIAKAYFDVVNKEIALTTVKMAIDTVGKIDNYLNLDAERILAEALQEIVSAQAYIGEYNYALQTAELITKEHYRITAIEAIVEALVNQEQLDIAMKIAKVHDVATLEIWLLRLKAEVEMRAGNTETFQEYLLEALRNVDRIKYKWQQAIEIAYIASMQARFGDTDKLEVLLADAFERAKETDEHKNRNMIAMAIIAQVIAETGDIEKAKNAFNQIFEYAMKNLYSPGYVTGFIEIITTGQVQVGLLNDALELAKKINHQWQQASIQNCIALVEAKAKRFTSALEIARSIKENNVRSKTIAKIAIEQAHTEEPNISLETIKEINFLESYSSQVEIAKILYKRGYKLLARTIFSQVLQGSYTINNQYAPVTALIYIATTQAQTGDICNAQYTFSTARQTTKVIEKQVFQVMALCDIAVAQMQVGDRQEAEITFDEAWQIIQNISSQTDRAWASKELANHQMKLKDLDISFKYAALHTVLSIDDSVRKSAILEEIALMQAEEEDIDYAFTFLQAITHDKSKESVIKKIKDWHKSQELITQYKLGYIPNTFEIEQIIDSQKVQAKTLIKLARFQFNDGLIELAKETLADALNIAQKVSNQGYDTELLEEIIIVQAENDLLFNFFDVRKIIKMKYKQAEVIRKIGKIKAQQGQYEEAKSAFDIALEISQQVDRELTHSSTISDVAQEQILAGFPEQAIRTTQMILTNQNWCLPKIAGAFVKTGDHANFKKLLIPCAYYLDAAYEMCGYLAQLYPEQAEVVATVVRA
ncbi:hypothetical protein DP117_19330 [Brasilonema sp. UFV-L1]|nr:AAA family ATPase [Brasilonema sp. UFV-L1]NMG08926.1 hypothetical protein [Brasilonema sp. UFV-L1]